MKKLFRIIVAICTLIALTGCPLPEKKHPQYVIFFDAGSSGTRVFIYEFESFDSNKDFYPNYTAAPVIRSNTETQWTLKVPHGLSNYSNTPEQIESYLSPLMKYVQDKISDPKQIAEAPTYFKATAGLRLLPPEDQQTLLETTRKTLKNNGFFIPQDDAVEIISGQHEGVYAWISVNHLLGTLKSNESSTFGIVELGGASLQVTFAPDSPPIESGLALNLGNLPLQLYSTSYLGLGLDQAYQTYFNEACAISPTSTTSFAKCRRSFAHKLGLKCSNDNTAGTCAFNGTYQPKPTGDFILLSGFYLTTAGDHKMDVSHLSVKDIRNKAKEVCSTPGIDAPAKSCFELSYVATLLAGSGNRKYDGIGLVPNYPHSIEAIKQLGPDILSWTLGATLYEMGKLHDL